MNRKRVGNNIRKRRKELRLTQADLAEKAGISVVHISHIENGKVSMSLETLISICNILDCTPNDVLLDEYWLLAQNNKNTDPGITPNRLLREKPLNPEDRFLIQRITHLLKEHFEGH